MIVLCIPGPWPDQSSLLKMFLEKHGLGFSLSDDRLLERESGRSCAFQWQAKDQKLGEAFTEDSENMSEQALASVEAHASAVKLISEDESFQATSDLAALAAVLLDLGGLGVRVESAGKAHDPKFWLAHYEDEDPLTRYNLFVTLLADEVSFFSCGMHQFGLPDVSVDKLVGAEEGAYLLNIFNLFCLIEEPELEDGQPFAAHDDDELVYIMTRRPYPEEYESHELLSNPKGRWHLETIEN